MNAAPEPGPRAAGAAVVAAFDFDGTLTRGDSLLPFLQEGLGRAGLARALLRTAPALLAWKLGRLDNEAAKVRLLQAALAGRPRAELEAWAARLRDRRLPALWRPEALARLRWHQAQGHRCVMVSASPELYLAPVAQALGLALLGSRLAWDAAGRATGALDGRNCHGPEKLRRLHAWWAGHPPAELWAYGDSAGDAALLAAADRPWYRGREGRG